ncbi:uncharacterized protein METZ01_LOCUS193911, partial [marine metagenome]
VIFIAASLGERTICHPDLSRADSANSKGCPFPSTYALFNFFSSGSKVRLELLNFVLSP